MSGSLIDTDWLIDVLHGRPDAVQTLIERAPSGLFVSHLTYGELYEGAFYARAREADLAALGVLIAGIRLLPTTIAIMERFAVIRGSLTAHVRRQVGDIDLLIAATALTHDLTLVTRNRKDFQLIADLKLLAAPA